MKLEIFAAFIVAMISIFSSCNKTSTPNDSETCTTIQTDSAAIGSKLLTLSSVEKIMGEQAKLTCNSLVKKSDTSEDKCDYTAVSPDEISGKTGGLYLMYEVYVSVTAAENAYTSIYCANSGQEGVEVVSGLGDEAYYHSDGANFYFLLDRKIKKMVRLKVNKVTSHSSGAECKDVI